MRQLNLKWPLPHLDDDAAKFQRPLTSSERQLTQVKLVRKLSCLNTLISFRKRVCPKIVLRFCYSLHVSV